jgi:arylsulfatase A-like enzyme
MAMALLVGCASSSLAASSRPNLIFVLADDLRSDALGCAGNAIVQTPQIDRLAREGVFFRNHCVTTSICAVSRASLFAGQYARRHGINDFATPFRREQWADTYPARLRKAGYQTGFIGKFGVGDAPSIKAMAAEFDFWRGLPGQGGLFFDKNDPTRTHATARFGSQALEFLRNCKPDQPFCLSLSFTAPHARDGQPREFPPDARDESLYRDAIIPIPLTATQQFFERLPKAVQVSESRARWQRRFDTPEKFAETTRDYLRLVTGIDREIGRIVAELRERSLAENTVIVFTSDNGFFFGERGLADKWFMYEESIRVPLIIYDPALPASARGRVVNALTLNLDLAPTLLDLAGLPAPSAMQGKSLVPLLRGDASPADARTEMFYEHHTLPAKIPPSEGVRTERWSYLQWVNEVPLVEELYDLRDDPLQTRNLAGDERFAAILAGLRARTAALREELK